MTLQVDLHADDSSSFSQPELDELLALAALPDPDGVSSNALDFFQKK